MHNPRRLSAALLALSVSSTSCWFRKSHAVVFTPPPPQSQPQKADANEPAVLPAPPNIEGNPTATMPPQTLETMPPQLEPPRAPPPRRGNVATTPPKPSPTPAPAPEPPPPPKLGQIFTGDQLREYNRALDESLERVRKALGVLAGKNLNAEQGEIAKRIRIFQRQAEQAREQDLVTAVSLARRADLLANDLLKRLP
jgi:hypothetical protein